VSRGQLHRMWGLCVLLLWPWASAVHAQQVQPKDAAEVIADADENARRAREFFEAGVVEAEAGRWREAHTLFEASRALHPRASTTFNLALSNFQLARLRDSIAEIDAFRAAADPQRQRAELHELAELRTRAEALLAVVVLTVTPEAARIWVDDRGIGQTGPRRELRLDPGSHEIRVVAPDHRPLSLSLSLEPAERRDQQLVLEPEAQASAPAPEPRADVALQSAGARSDPADIEDSRSTWLWIGVGIVAASVGALAAGYLIGDDGEGPELTLHTKQLP